MPNGTFTNEDCMAVMARYPDKHFDLAIVDPPYGGGGTDNTYGRFGNKNSRFARYGYDCPGIDVSRVGGNRFSRYEHAEETGGGVARCSRR